VKLSAISDRELLALPIRDLHLSIEHSELEPRVRRLYRELARKGLAIRPVCYLGDEWFSPEDTPLISIPFYLAHPRLKALERKMMGEVEGGDARSCMRLLRHECGHAVEHAYRLHTRARRRALFGSRGGYHPDRYRKRPRSRSYVRYLPDLYAQAHPDEDFAETFAVWLDPDSRWRSRYRGWKALEKLEYLDALMEEVAGQAPKVKRGFREYSANRMAMTLESFYRQRRPRVARRLP